MQNNEMNKLFAEGGMMDDSGEVVKGVEVPTGSLASEVADNIPAQLSEGEFVIPADVVRYIGLEKLMAIRDKAKQGLSRMEEMGQMGNADQVNNPDQTFAEEDGEYEDDDFEGNIDSIMAEDGGDEVKMAAGGYMTGADLSKAPKNSAIDVRYFKHTDGRRIYITYINNRPMTAIPEGFTETDDIVEKQVGKAAEEKAAATSPIEQIGGDSGGESPFGGNNESDNTGADPSTGSSSGASTAAANTGLGLMAIGQNPFALAVSPFGAVAANAAGKAIADQQINAINDSFSALSNTPAGMQSVSDANGNISTVSNNASIAAQNTAEFGIADVDAPDIGTSGDVGSGGPSGGGGGGGGGDGTYICTASYNLSMITPTHFKSLKQYGIGLRKNDQYLMRAYDSFGPKLASYVGKSVIVDKAAKFLTDYYKAVQIGDTLATKQKAFSYVSDYILRPTYRIIGWVLIKIVDKK